MADRTSWLDEEGGVAIDDMAKRLTSFMEAMEDGVISQDELDQQESRVAGLMKEVEPKLDDETQAMVEAEQRSGPYRMANRMGVDDVIDPRDLRNAILNGLMLTEGRDD